MRRKLRGQWSFTDPWLSAEPAQELAAMSALLAMHPTAGAEVEIATAAAQKIETGAKVRVDTTVVESPIHWLPTPSCSGTGSGS